MKINIEDVLAAQAVRHEINNQDIYDIEWYQDGEKLNIPKSVLESWKFTGLSNTDFVNFCLDEIEK